MQGTRVERTNDLHTRDRREKVSDTERQPGPADGTHQQKEGRVPSAGPLEATDCRREGPADGTLHEKSEGPVSGTLEVERGGSRQQAPRDETSQTDEG